MKCPRCQAENDDRLKFCEDCGAPLARACPNCGAQIRPGKKFCGECGFSLDISPTSRFASPQQYTPKHLVERILLSKDALEGERKQVTVLFADLKGSMELLADRDPEEARQLLDPVLERMIQSVHRYEGTVNQVMGDGIMALFGAPLALEDHAVLADWRARHGQQGRLVVYGCAGCQRCEGSGFKGRLGLHELMVVDRPLRTLIQSHARSEDLQRSALAAGMRTLRQDGIEKVLAGLTTIEEVRATSNV